MKDKPFEYKLKTADAAVRPFIYERPSISSICIKILILLFLQILLLLFSKTYMAIAVIACSLMGALCASALTYLLAKDEPYHAYTTVIQGICIGMFLPQNYPLIPVFFISFLCLFLSRTFIFKSITAWLNITALAIIIAWFIGKSFFPEFIVTNEIIPFKNSSLYLIQNGSFPVMGLDSTITTFLNNYVFKFFKVTLPEGYVSMFWDTHSTIPAFRFNLLTIISSIVLFSDNSFSGIIPLTFLFVFGLLVRIFVPFLSGGSLLQGDIILAFLTSGTLFCMVFLIQWWGTTPVSIMGKIIFGIFAGIFAFVTCGCGTAPIGMMYTVLACNFCSLMIRVLEELNNKAMVSRNVAKYVSAGEKTK